jgi:hypothetical protein
MNKLISLLLILFSLNACQNANKAKKLNTIQAKTSVAKSDNHVAVAADKDGIEGTYTEKLTETETGSCPIEAIITKTLKGYHYQLTLSEQHYEGTATLTASDQETYLTFEGIPWAEYEGDISGDTTEQTTDKTTPETPVGISTLVQNKELSIQNTGNSMNYYVKFEGCDRKYVTLIKR